MKEPTTKIAKSTDNNTFDPVQEVRFAMVLNGGVSLAIYINGITQEFLKLVRATAPQKESNGDFPNKAFVFTDELKGTELVYRKLGQFLGSGKCKLEEVNFEKDPIRTRFVIDIISGTSAGGINGVFLAKALANDQKMDGLKALWIDEGAIEKLINDHLSVRDLPRLPLQDPPGSLLNSQRMYYKLLEALEKMEGAERTDGTAYSPYVEELDLYVTASDNDGLLLPVKLSDRVVYEKRHRNVFHFMYATAEATGSTGKDDISVPLNHFQAKNNPFLAFAARCTSSFPFAFEPMRLSDIDPVLEKFLAYTGKKELYGAESRAWQKFYKDYRNQHNEVEDFPKRAFSDGGELDNIPFGHAIAALDNRRADVPVDRKLIYIDPSPPHPESEPNKIRDQKPNVIENVTAAVFTLPRTETIREDVERIKERNRSISRLHRITHGIEHLDIGEKKYVRSSKKLDVADWVKQDLSDMLQTKGLAYGGYYRLKVGAVTDELAELITRVAGFNEDSDEAVAIQYLVRAWRNANYETYHTENSKKSTQNKFLLNFDLSYRLRRLSFLQRKIDQLYKLSDSDNDKLFLEEIAKITEKKLSPHLIKEKDNQKFLKDLKAELSKIYLKLRATGRQLRSRSEDHPSPLAFYVQATMLESKELLEILLELNEKNRMKSAEALIQKKLYEFKELELVLIDCLKNAFVDATEQCTKKLHLDENEEKKVEIFKQHVRKLLSHYYTHYEDYDMILFPIMHSADLGEADEVEIIRVSPEDSDSLIDEKKTGYRKLAGTAFGNFGAFLDRTWRENDILWGRLDAAERIIKTLLVEYPEEAEKLVLEAVGYIVVEEMQAKCRQEFHRILIQPFLKAPSGKNRGETESVLESFIVKLKEATEKVPTRLRQRSGRGDIVEEYLNIETIKCYFLESLNQQGGQLQPESTLRSLARMTTVVGKIFEGVSAEYSLPTKPAAWITWIGRFFWGLVEIAVPRSIWNLLAHYWIRLLYLFEILLIGVGTALDYIPIRNFGWMALGGTLLLHFFVKVFEKLMKRENIKIVLWRGIAVVAVALVGLSVFELQHLPEDISRLISLLFPGRQQQ